MVLILQSLQVAMSIGKSHLLVDLANRIPDIEDARREVLATESHPWAFWTKLALVLEKLTFVHVTIFLIKVLGSFQLGFCEFGTRSVDENVVVGDQILECVAFLIVE